MSYVFSLRHIFLMHIQTQYGPTKSFTVYDQHFWTYVISDKPPHITTTNIHTTKTV